MAGPGEGGVQVREGLFQRATPPPPHLDFPVFSGVESVSSKLGTTLWNEECENWD